MTNPCDTCCEEECRPTKCADCASTGCLIDFEPCNDGNCPGKRMLCEDCRTFDEEADLFYCTACKDHPEEQSQYKEPCKNCKLVLSEDVHIMCCENKDGREMVVCSECWFDLEDEWRAEGWTCDEDEE